jgi:hypothetical protein
MDSNAAAYAVLINYIAMSPELGRHGFLIMGKFKSIIR